jgi:hypothetical protein
LMELALALALPADRPPAPMPTVARLTATIERLPSLIVSIMGS